MARLSREFYNRDTLTAACELLGKYVVHRLEGELLAGRIVETEAYIGRCDKACHAYNYRRTKRTETLFAQPGTSYIYLIYGMYHCLNFVTEPENEPAAGGREDDGAPAVRRQATDKLSEKAFCGRSRKGLPGIRADPDAEWTGPDGGRIISLRKPEGDRDGSAGAGTGTRPDRPENRHRLCGRSQGLPMAVLAGKGGR